LYVVGEGGLLEALIPRLIPKVNADLEDRIQPSVSTLALPIGRREVRARQAVLDVVLVHQLLEGARREFTSPTTQQDLGAP
jgi:hypothetical protein